MTKTPSLVLRIVALLALAQLPAFLITWLLLDSLNLWNTSDFAVLSENFDTIAIWRTTGLVGDSLIRDSDGSLRIEPTPSLRAEMQRLPGLQFAAYDPVQWTPLAGSSEKLTSRLSTVAVTRPRHMHFVVNDITRNDVTDGRFDGHLRLRETRFGEVPIAVYGFRFRWDDLSELLQYNPVDWSFVRLSIVIVAVVTGGTAWFAVRRGLKPLADVAKEVEHIDMSSLHRRLSTSGIPAEIKGLVDVVNEAFDRLESGVDRQRQFAANAAHELRTPLAIMRAQLECEKPSAVRNELLSAASRLRSIVEQMLISTRLAEGQVALDQRVDVDGTVQQLACDLLPLAMNAGRSLEFESAGLPLVTLGNQRAIECVVTNLIDNALRAEPKGGVVCVRVEADGVIAVIDHGEGVESADHERIFERFWRKSDATSGTGLGLAIAKDIMDAHGGRIWVEDTPGGGATFKLAFRKSAEWRASVPDAQT